MFAASPPEPLLSSSPLPARASATRVISSMTSEGAATARRIRRPVIWAISSAASQSAGSIMATTSAPSSVKATGTAS